MIRNYLIEDDLKGYLPLLDDLLWTGDEDYSAQKRDAEMEVMDDYLNSDYKAIFLRPDLTLRSSTSSLTVTTIDPPTIEDIISRARWVYNIISFTGANNKTLILQGTNDTATVWTDISTVTLTSTSQAGEFSQKIDKLFKFYRTQVVLSDGAIAWTSFLTEISYDLLYKYKWLQIILFPMIKSSEQYKIWYDELNKLYDNKFNRQKIVYDENEDSEITETEITFANQMTLSR